MFSTYVKRSSMQDGRWYLTCDMFTLIMSSYLMKSMQNLSRCSHHDNTRSNQFPQGNLLSLKSWKKSFHVIGSFPKYWWTLKYVQRMMVTFHLFNSSPPSAAYTRQWTVSALVQLMACRPFGTKLSPKSMLAYCKLDSWKQISGSESIQN